MEEPVNADGDDDGDAPHAAARPVPEPRRITRNIKDRTSAEGTLISFKCLCTSGPIIKNSSLCGDDV